MDDAAARMPVEHVCETRDEGPDAIEMAVIEQDGEELVIVSAERAMEDGSTMREVLLLQDGDVIARSQRCEHDDGVLAKATHTA